MGMLTPKTTSVNALPTPAKSDQELPQFTGEYFVPGKAPRRLEDDHLARYRLASCYVAGKEVLDIACGTGYGTKMLAAQGAKRVDGVDISPDLIKHALSFGCVPALSFYQGDICVYSREVQYDIITSFETIEHIASYDLALKNLHSLLKRGGSLHISTPNRLITSPYAKEFDTNLSNSFHSQEWTVSEFLSLIRKHGFSVEGSHVLGQRLRPYFRSRVFKGIYRRLFDPDNRASPAPRNYHWPYQPRYIYLIAEKE